MKDTDRIKERSDSKAIKMWNRAARKIARRSKALGISAHAQISASLNIALSTFDAFTRMRK
ncbi:MAG: hypothetical protein ACI83D_000757 [Planctomycetota bacterium]|jgi:hypothetical protein